MRSSDIHLKEISQEIFKPLFTEITLKARSHSTLQLNHSQNPKPMVRRESLGIGHGQSMVIGRVLHVGITGNSMCLAAYHWQIYFSVLRQCPGSASAVEQLPTAIPHAKHSKPKLTQNYHLRPRSCTWFRRGVLGDRGFTNLEFHWKLPGVSELILLITVTTHEHHSILNHW